MIVGKPRGRATIAARTLAVDIGGTGIKMVVLDGAGTLLTQRVRVRTPKPSTPAAVMSAIVDVANTQGAFERVSIGFPGVVRQGVTVTAPNLGRAWEGFDLATALSKKLGKPVRVANDADVQGLGVIAGRGVELVITLGTGFGSALFLDGTLVPNLELAHHPFRAGKTYEDTLGLAALKKAGKQRWNRRLEKAIRTLAQVFNYDRLYLGGGHAKKITIALPSNVTCFENVTGLLGGLVLWRDEVTTRRF